MAKPYHHYIFNHHRDPMQNFNLSKSTMPLFLPFSMMGSVNRLLVSANGSLLLFAMGLFAAVGRSAIFFCRFSRRARVRSNNFW